MARRQHHGGPWAAAALLAGALLLSACSFGGGASHGGASHSGASRGAASAPPSSAGGPSSASSSTGPVEPASGGTSPAGSAPAGGGPAGSSSTATAPVDIVSTATLRLPARPTPASPAPALHPQDVAFAPGTAGRAGVGLLAASGQRIGTADGVHVSRPGRIQRSTDGGTAWTTVWRGPHTSLDWIGWSGAGGVAYASGARFLPGGPPTGSPVLLRSTDGGATWSALTPRVPAAAAPLWWQMRFAFPDGTAGYAVVDPAFSGGPPTALSGVLETADGGRTWHLVPLPGGARPSGGLAFPGPGTGYVTGADPRCPGEVFRTSDGGAGWQPLAASCEPFGLFALDFPSAASGFAAGGRSDKFGAPPWQAVLATSDGGRTWQTRYEDRQSRDGWGGPVARLRFADSQHGWAVTGTCVMGQNTPCGGDVLATSDGGRTWRAAGPPAAVVFRLSATGSATAWALAARSTDVLWRTADGGRTWKPAVRPAGLQPRLLSAAGSRLLATTAAGALQSGDGGATWGLLPAELPPYAGQVLAGLAPDLLAYPGAQGSSIHVSADGGTSWHAALLPDGAPGGGGGGSPGAQAIAVAFADPQHLWAASFGQVCSLAGFRGSRLWGSGDGGATWSALPRLPLAEPVLAAAPGLLAATGMSSCDREGAAVALSTDGGRSWHTQQLPPTYACAPGVAAPATVWLACRGALLTSDNGGRTWRRLLDGGTVVTSAAPAGGSSGWITAGWPPALWHTADGGRTWTEVWPTLP